VCAVPLLDMVRYHLFGSGKTWIPEYGSVEDPAQFEAIVTYSPFHQVRGGTAYPAMLMMSADHDDRVDPLHARKFTAQIQHATSSDKPALLRIEKMAGHGGADSGAVGPTGLMEKDLVLDVTRRVARLVEDRLGIKVTLSRSADNFIPLNERTSFANREHADLFVSIHANAHRDFGSEGVETYFLSLEATDNAARQVAERENEVVKLESPASRRKMDVLRTILWDLSQSVYLEESSTLAEIVQDSMTEALRIPNRGVKQAGFYVLGGAAMPAVLIEIGFVTNPKEERRLKESRYRDEIARAIFAGIAEYKKRYDQRMRAAVPVVKTSR